MTAAPSAVASSALDLPADLLTRPDEDDVLLRVPDNAPARVRQWKRALLDLSTRNRLLNLRRSAEVLDLHIPTDTLALLDDIVRDGKPVALVAQDQLSELQRLRGARRAQDLDDEDLVRILLVEDHAVILGVTQRSYVASLRKLQRTARTMLQETGNANLYLTIGALIHRTPSGQDARAPLFLLPVKIEGGGGRSAFQIRVDNASVASPNYCLLEWLRIKHGVCIEALETQKLDGSGIDIVAALPAVRDALVEHRLDVRIDEVATLAICQFSTFGMWRDLQHSWDVLALSPVAEHLAMRPTDTFRDPAAAGDEDLDAISVDEAETPLPIPADGSQQHAVALAAAGRSFVLEGPPGTGKSQTITNLIAHAMASGKTVLFVAEKQAALDIVKRRLAEVGLSDFTLDLHGRSQRPAEIRAQLKRAIDNVTFYDRRAWEAVRAKLRARHAPLQEYPQRIHEKNGVDVSLWGAFENLQQYGQGPVAAIPATYVAAAGTDETPIKDAVRNFARSARTVGLRPAHPWSIVGRIADDLDPRALTDAAATLETARTRLDAYPEMLALLQRLYEPGDLDALIPYLEDRASGPVPDTARLVEVRSAAWNTSREQLFDEVRQFSEQHAGVLTTFTWAFLEHGETAALVDAADTAQRGLFGKKKRGEEFEQTLKPLLAQDVALRVAQVRGMIIGVDAARTHAAQLRVHVAEVFGDAAARAWTPLRPDALARLDEAWKRIARSEQFERLHPELWRFIQEAAAPSLEVIKALQSVAAAWTQWRTLLGSGEGEWALWLNGRHWTAAWADDGAVWTRETADAADASVRRWDRMAALLDPLHAAGLDDFREALMSARIDAADAEIAYLRGVATASVRERRDAAGLQGFDAALRDGEITDYAQAAEASRSEQKVALPAELLNRRPYRGDRLTGQVGDLRRRLNAKRASMSFRQLIGRYGDEILQAAPCFFVSPASLAQYVPPGAVTFDLVVFDEASQVTVAQAIGAIGRGKSAIIVGDSQQMPPTSIGKAKVTDTDPDDEDEPEIIEDLESILTECVESGLPQVWLSWHYRSQDEALIAFSNTHYYKGQLASLPSPGGDPSMGVELRRVDGHFNREDRTHEFRTNRVEAEAIVQEIRRSLADPHSADHSIGVVTFNRQQRDLVLNLLEECNDPLVARQLREDAPEGIFVKNLENVQGDERDIILFSVAFSKPREGGALPMNFGPLGWPGGEKRLNVAITRARRKVILVASFDPADIDLSRTTWHGIAHLRSYLEFADQGPSALVAQGGRPMFGTDHVREAIAGALQERGYEVASDYGLSDFSLDLAVREAGADRWQVAIVLDGPRWAERPTVADRDLTPLLLEQLMGWGASMRVWLPEWIDDAERVLHRVDDAITQARARQEQERIRHAAEAAHRERAIVDAATKQTLLVDEDLQEADDRDEDTSEDGAVEVETFTLLPATDQSSEAEPIAGGEPADAPVLVGIAIKGGNHSSGLTAVTPAPCQRDMHARRAPYVEIDAIPLGARDDLGRTASLEIRGTIATAVRETVELEGPITTSRLARSIGRRFGFDRVAAGRQEFILQAVPAELVRTSVLGEFVWPPGVNPETWRGYRTTPEDVERPLTDVAPEKIINAMADVAAQRVCTDDEELFRATLAVFGQRRLTGQTTARLQTCRDIAVQASRLIRTETGLWRAGA